VLTPALDRSTPADFVSSQRDHHPRGALLELEQGLELERGLP
jgi:hypothetical protein